MSPWSAVRLPPTLARLVEGRPVWPFTWVAGFLLAWGVLARLLPRGLPAGIVVMGLVFGAFYALVAAGLVLIYRANRIVNFAQAEVGVVAAVVAIELVVQWGVNYFLAVAVGLILALAMGAAINVLVVRRFRNSPRLILTVATIGLAQILSGLALIIPAYLTLKANNHRTFSTPFSAHFSVYPVVFTANHVVAIVAVVAVAAGLSAFLRLTSYGVAIRAAAENNERATLLGVPVNRLDMIVWGLAGLFSALAVILRVPVLGFNSFGSVSGGGNALLLRTLAAAVIGRMENLPRTVMAALGIGVFDTLATWTSSNTTLVDASLVAVVVVALLAQKGAISRVVGASLSSWKAIREVRPIPNELRRLPEVRAGIRLFQLIVAAVAVAVPVILSTSQTYLAALVLIYAIVGLSLLVLTGWAGQISLGQFALAGFGGATTALLYGRHGWDFFLALAAGMATAALVALLIGLPALRIQGPFLAVTTLAFGVSASEYFLNGVYLPWFVQSDVSRPNLFGRLPLDQDWQMYYATLVALVLAVGAVRSLRHSRVGRALIATRDNEPAARAAKVDTTRLKLTAFMVSGALAGLAGALFVVHQHGVYPNSFSADTSIALFSMVVIGGLGSIPGVILGAVYVFGAQYFLSGGFSFLASGAGILVLLLFFPEGLGGLVYRARDGLLRRVALRRNIIVPSLVADLRVEERVGVGDILAGAASTNGSANGHEPEPVGAAAGGTPRRRRGAE
ncbi:MAG TPA: ABC transporter permease [Acidimicrobiales bacterium]|nr:ABC transporter permease [Acidimicrobiales bacterium]